MTSSILAAEAWSTVTVAAEGTSIRVVLPYAKTPDDDSKVEFTRKTQAAQKVDLLAACFTDVDYRHALVTQFIVSRGYKYSPDRWFADLTRQHDEYSRANPAPTAAMLENAFDKATKLEAAAQGVTFSFEKPVLFPISDESVRHFTCLGLFGFNMEVRGVNERHVAVGSITVIFVGGELLSIMVYEPFVDRSTYTKVQELTKEVVRRTLAANQN